MFDNQTSVCHFIAKGDGCVGVYNQTSVCHFVAKGDGCVGVYNQTSVCHFVPDTVAVGERSALQL